MWKFPLMISMSFLLTFGNTIHVLAQHSGTPFSSIHQKSGYSQIEVSGGKLDVKTEYPEPAEFENENDADIFSSYDINNSTLTFQNFIIEALESDEIDATNFEEIKTQYPPFFILFCQSKAYLS